MQIISGKYVYHHRLGLGFGNILQITYFPDRSHQDQLHLASHSDFLNQVSSGLYLSRPIQKLDRVADQNSLSFDNYRILMSPLMLSPVRAIAECFGAGLIGTLIWPLSSV